MLSVRQVLTVDRHALRDVRYERRCLEKLFDAVRHDFTVVRHDLSDVR